MAKQKKATAPQYDYSGEIVSEPGPELAQAWEAYKKFCGIEKIQKRDDTGYSANANRRYFFTNWIPLYGHQYGLDTTTNKPHDSRT